MGGSITLVVIFVVIAVGIAALLIYRQRSAQSPLANGPTTRGHAAASRKGSARPHHPVHGSHVQQWGVRIAHPAKEKACPQVRAFMGKEFPLESKPALPVKDCPFPRECECQYVKLFDRRKEERRSGKERRSALRAEAGHGDRRSGKDRRKGKNLDWV